MMECSTGTQTMTARDRESGAGAYTECTQMVHKRREGERTSGSQRTTIHSVAVSCLPATPLSVASLQLPVTVKETSKKVNQ